MILFIVYLYFNLSKNMPLLLLFKLYKIIYKNYTVDLAVFEQNFFLLENVILNKLYIIILIV